MIVTATSPYICTSIETERDLSSLNKKAHQIMSRIPITLSITEEAYKAIDIFNEQNVSCIPIVDKNNKPVDIVTWRNSLKYIKYK